MYLLEKEKIKILAHKKSTKLLRVMSSSIFRKPFQISIHPKCLEKSPHKF
jgi:hypothetical protein